MKLSTSTYLWCFAGCLVVFLFLYASLFLMLSYRLSLKQIDTQYGAYHIQRQGLGCGSACYRVVFCELWSCGMMDEYIVINGLKSINDIYVDEFGKLVVVVPQGTKVSSNEDYNIIFE